MKRESQVWLVVAALIVLIPTVAGMVYGTCYFSTHSAPTADSKE
jgi:hypothetical protein